MGADHVAILGTRHRSDHRSARACAVGAPVNGKVVLAARLGVRGKADMVDPIGWRHRKRPLNGDGPPKQTGLITNNATDSPAKTGIRKYNHPVAEYNRQEMANGIKDNGS
jgi:hypothetical protein